MGDDERLELLGNHALLTLAAHAAVLADAAAAALLALAAHAVVLADAGATALLAHAAMAVVLADAVAAALLALAAHAVVLAHVSFSFSACSSTVLSSSRRRLSALEAYASVLSIAVPVAVGSVSTWAPSRSLLRPPASDVPCLLPCRAWQRLAGPRLGGSWGVTT